MSEQHNQTASVNGMQLFLTTVTGLAVGAALVAAGAEYADGIADDHFVPHDDAHRDVAGCFAGEGSISAAEIEAAEAWLELFAREAEVGSAEQPGYLISDDYYDGNVFFRRPECAQILTSVGLE